MEAACAELETALPVFRAALDTYRKALDSGLGDEDKGSMIKVFEKELGVLFRRGATASEIRRNRSTDAFDTI